MALTISPLASISTIDVFSIIIVIQHLMSSVGCNPCFCTHCVAKTPQLERDSTCNRLDNSNFIELFQSGDVNAVNFATRYSAPSFATYLIK